MPGLDFCNIQCPSKIMPEFQAAAAQQKEREREKMLVFSVKW
jgi:hypothetical protein